MDDKELPGFKINDYSGDGDSGATEGAGGAADGSMAVEDGSVAGGGGSVAGGGGSMPAENSPVTHGEGEIKPVMLENVSEGGSEEKAPKTAPEGAEGQFAGSKVDSASGAGVDQSRQITEAEARAMLIEDNARAKEALKKANNRGKKTLVAVIVLAVLLVVAGVATSIILGGMKDDAKNNDKQEGNNSVVVEEPEKPEELEIVELSLDDELVQALYGPFAVIKNSYYSSFYSTEIDDYGFGEKELQQRMRRGRLEVAYLNSSKETCKATVENGGLIARYDDFILNWPDEQRASIEQCVSGEKVRQNFKDIFGYEIELNGFDNYQNPDEVADVDAVFTETYSPSYDEFYYNLGGAGTPTMYKRRLVAAEKEADVVYLYEQGLGYYYASWMFGGNDSVQVRVYDLARKYVSDNDSSIIIEDAKANIEVMLEGGELFNHVGELGELGMFKWTFVRNAAGNYVFEGLERVE